MGMKRILMELLKEKQAWNQKTGEPNVSWLQDAYIHMREALFLREVYFPKMFEKILQLKKSEVYPKECFEWFKYEDDVQGWWINDEDIPFDLGGS